MFFANLVAAILLTIASLILKNIFKNAANTVQTGDPRLTAGGGSSTGLVVRVCGVTLSKAGLTSLFTDYRTHSGHFCGSSGAMARCEGKCPRPVRYNSLAYGRTTGPAVSSVSMSQVM